MWYLFIFQVVIEASVGNTGMSNIALDDITFVEGPCPGKISYIITSIK